MEEVRRFCSKKLQLSYCFLAKLFQFSLFSATVSIIQMLVWDQILLRVNSLRSQVFCFAIPSKHGFLIFFSESMQYFFSTLWYQVCRNPFEPLCRQCTSVILMVALCHLYFPLLDGPDINDNRESSWHLSCGSSGKIHCRDKRIDGEKIYHPLQDTETNGGDGKGKSFRATTTFAEQH